MSLETKIEELTSAINLLTKAILERDVVELVANIVEPTVEVTEEAVKGAEEKAQKKTNSKAKKESNAKVTAEEVQAVCLKLVREDGAKKAAIVELLNGYGAKTVGQVAPEKLSELKTKLEAL